MYTGFKLTLVINDVTAARAHIESLMKCKYLAVEMPDDSEFPKFHLTYHQFWNDHSTDFEFTSTFCTETQRLNMHCWGNAEAVDITTLLDDLSPLNALIPLDHNSNGIVEGCYLENDTDRDELTPETTSLALPPSWGLEHGTVPLHPSTTYTRQLDSTVVK
jgi:hypothetical protein